MSTKKLIKNKLPYIPPEDVKMYEQARCARSKKDDEQINNHYAGREVMSIRDTHQAISKAIEEGKPFWTGRFGGTEVKTMNFLLTTRHPHLHHHRYRQVREDILRDSGFFDKGLASYVRFVELMLKGCSEIDILAQWNLRLEEYYIEQYMGNAKISFLRYLEPWRLATYGESEKIAWTNALANKKVLVVHPFAKTIQYQYLNKRKLIFNSIKDNEPVFLPEFELHTVEAFQTLGRNRTEYSSWFDALDALTEKCARENFDVAIIACGAYGFPLSHRIKQMGKVVIHLAGATQLLFGIMGNRWNEDADVLQYVNDAWTRASAEEKPDSANSVEGACYW